MSSLEAKRLYYDTNTGLMPIIQALIAPPVSEEDAETERRAKREKREKKVEKKEGLDLHPYYKKRGKSHNHDYCDACLEGGNLLCCDTCEASFHLECNDPPLHVDEIPLDMWQCRRCTKLHKESPSKKGSPGKNSKRRKSNNSNTSSTSTNNYKKLKTSHGQESEEEGFARPPNKDNHYNNHGGGGANDSGDSDISSVSTTRRRGRPRKYPLPTPVRAKTNNKGNLSDSDTESVQENRSKRFMKRRKKEPPKNNTTPPGGDNKSQNPADGDQSTSSDEGPLQTGERDRLTASGSSTINNNFGKNRSLPNAVASSREVPTPRISSVYRGDSSHIGYLKYSSSDDEDSHSEKSLYFRDMVLQGSKPLTEEYLDENTGEIMTRSLCENEYLSKLLSKKNTTSEIDDIERINELLLKTKNMAMDPNIIKKIIGCSIPEQSDGSDENGNAYDSDEDERTSEEDAGVEERSYPPASSNDQQAQPINSTTSLPEISKDISEDATVSGQSKDIPESGNKQSKDISNDSSRPSGSSSNVNSSNSNEAVEQIAAVQSNIELSKPSSQSSNDSSSSVPATPLVSDPRSTQQDMGQPQPTTKDGLKSTNPTTEGGEQDEEMEEEEEKSDEELASLRKFSALWREKFGEEEGSGEEEEEGEEESGRESETSEEWEEEGEEGKTLAPAEPMDFQAERAVHTEASCVDPDQPENKPSTEEITEESRKFPALSVDEDGKAQESNKTEPKEKKALSSLLEEDAVESSLDDIEIDWTDKSNEVEVRNAMQILLSAVALSNPEQFSLGKFEDKSYDKYVWPGTDKIPDTARLSSKRARALMNVTELDSDGLVPAPLRLCHACGRACGRRAPLLGCDYCPLAYHLDCLEPPLASVPTLTWLCPAHPTALLDRVLGAAEGGVVERGEVWDAWATRPVSEEQVTREFLSKVRSQSQRHRIKRSRIPAKIPGFVSFHYQRPPELAPSLQEALHLQAVAERERGEERGASREEKEQFLRSLIALETQLLRLSYENKSSSPPTTASSSDTKLKASSSTAVESEPTKLKVEDDEKAEESSPSEKSILENQLESAATKPTDKKETSDTRVDSAATIRVEVNGDLVTTVVEMDSQEVLGSMHDSADKLDSYFRFGEDFLTPPPPPSSAHNVTMSTVNNFKLDDINPNNFKVEDLFITTTLPLNNSDESFILDKSEDACIEEDKSIEEEIVSLDEVKEDLLDEKEVKEEEVKEEEERIGWEEKEEEEEVKEEVLEVKVEEEENKVEEKAEVNMKRSLFVQLNELLRNAKLPADDKTGAIIDLSDIQQLNPDLVQVLALERLSQLVVSDTPSLLPQPHLSHPYAPFVPRRSAPPSRLHAQLCPLSRKLGPVPMTSNWMTIGLGPNSTVDLSRFGFCSRVSAQHAVIFYEMASNTYELVNTSEFGTRVDSLLYTLDTSLPASSSSHHHHHRHAPSLSSAHQARLKFRAAASERIKQDAFTWDARAGRMRTREGMERRKKRRRRRVMMEGQEEEERLPLHYGETIYKCACLADEKSEKEEDSADTSSSSRKASSQGGGGKQHSSSAWESTCLVRHGSLLQFGCFKFVFSVTEHTRPLPPPYDTLSHRRASQLTTAELPNPGAATATATGETGVVTGDEASAALQEGGKQASVEGGKQASVEGGKQASVEGGKQASVEGGKQASVEGGKQASVEGGKQASVEAGKQASARLASSAGDVGEQHKPAPCQNKSASSKQGKEFKPTRRKTAGTKVKRRGGSSANAKHSAGSSTDTCSESEEYDAEKD